MEKLGEPTKGGVPGLRERKKRKKRVNKIKKVITARGFFEQTKLGGEKGRFLKISKVNKARAGSQISKNRKVAV